MEQPNNVRMGDELVCVRCGNAWRAGKDGCPVVCASCKAREWWRPAVAGLGRPKRSGLEVFGDAGLVAEEVVERVHIKKDVPMVPRGGGSSQDVVVRKKLEAIAGFIPGVSIGMPGSAVNGDKVLADRAAVAVEGVEPKSLGFVGQIAGMTEGDANEEIKTFTRGKVPPSHLSRWHGDRRLHWKLAEWLDKNKYGNT